MRLLRPYPGLPVRDWLMHLYDYVRSLAVSGDNKTCMVTRGVNGTVITVLPQAFRQGRDPEYRGFFALELADNVVSVKSRVFCGSGKAGVFRVGPAFFTAPEGTVSASTGGCVLLKATEEGFSAYEVAASLPSVTPGAQYGYFPLGWLEPDAANGLTLFQFEVGLPTVLLTKSCDTEA